MTDKSKDDTPKLSDMLSGDYLHRWLLKDNLPQSECDDCNKAARRDHEEARKWWKQILQLHENEDQS